MSADAPRFKLRITVPDGTKSEIPIERGQHYTIGQSPSCSVCLDYAGLAPRHLLIQGGEPLILVNLGGNGATQVGSRHLKDGERCELYDGDIISVGQLSISVFQGTAAPVSRSLAPDMSASRPSTGKPRKRTTSGTMVSPAAMVIRDPKMRGLYSFVRQVAKTDVGILILGETGVGKELLARAVHENSDRRAARMVTLNCAAIPENLVESELFGYERGAFSGASVAKPGLFESAHQSTLFLDEVGELAKSVQSKLLRILDLGEVQRLGSVHPFHVDVRIVAATNRDIQAEVASGAFRADLFYRLNGMQITVPPLRERPEDIPALAEFFAAQTGRLPVPRLSPEALQALGRYYWPGNVRELRSVIARAVLLAPGDEVSVEQLVFDPPPALSGSRISLSSPRASLSSPRLSMPSDAMRPISAVSVSDPFTCQELPTGAVAAQLEAELARREERRVREALERAGGNQKDAAKLLGVSRRTLINRLERHGIARPRKRRDDV